jgi:methionyl-tRNA formyltransferase
MGTPEFAVTILDGILKDGLEIVGVITAPDKPAGRGRQINQSAVKKYSVENNLTVLQPTNLKDESFISELKSLKADLFVVVAFRMLPEIVWSMPQKGTINLHASLLPNYRGAAPINWAIINGEQETGVTTFFIEKEIDTGNIIDYDIIQITPDMTAGTLHDVLAAKGKETMLKTIYNINANTAIGTSQNTSLLTDIKNAPKIFKDDCLVNWQKGVKETHDFIRGLSPYPAAWCKLEKNDKIFICKLFNSSITNVNSAQSTKILTDDGFLFPCKDKYIRIEELQLEGKRRMTWKEFNAGNRIDDFSLILS